MSRASLKKRWSWLAKSGVLMLGFGAWFGADAQAGRSDLKSPKAQNHSGPSADEVLIRTEGDRISISQRGDPFQELLLGDTPEGTYLRKLLKDAGAAEGLVSVPVGSIIVANGGGRKDGAKPKEASTSQPEEVTPPKDKQPDKKGKQPLPTTSKPTNGK